MIEIILILISIVIIIYVTTESKKVNKKSFETIIDKAFVSSENRIIFDEKKIDFIKYLRKDILKNKNRNFSDENKKDNSSKFKKNELSKFNRVEELLEKGYNEIEICRIMSIGKGEYLLILNFLNMKDK